MLLSYTFAGYNRIDGVKQYSQIKRKRNILYIQEIEAEAFGHLLNAGRIAIFDHAERCKPRTYVVDRTSGRLYFQKML